VSLPFAPISSLYPPRAFCFTFSFDGSSVDASFQEISGLKTEWTTQEVAEGGQNSYVHRLPLRTKFSNLVLKRGVVRHASPLAAWLTTSFSANFAVQKVQPKTAIVMLLDVASRPLVQWTLSDAYPVAWDHSALNATESNLLIETIELSCSRFDRKSYVYSDETNAA
jgi:phage tail-like protein